MIRYKRNAYYLDEKFFSKYHRLMKIVHKGNVTVYRIGWKELLTMLETLIITSIKSLIITPENQK